MYHQYNYYKYYITGSPDSPYPSIAFNANSSDCFIAPGQSVFVRANAGGASINITKEASSHTNINFFKSGEEKKHPNLLRLKVELDGMSDETILRFIPEATAGYDGEFDAIKRYASSGDVPQLYFPAINAELAINTLPKLADGLIVPFVLITGKLGKYTISATELNFDADIDVYLIDNELHKKINLTKVPSYSFIADADNYENRFNIIFKSYNLPTAESSGEELLDIDKLDTEVVQIYSFNAKVFINIENIENNNIVIIQDILGKKLVKTNLTSDKTEISMNKFSQGNYIVKVITNNKVYEQKVFIGK